MTSDRGSSLAVPSYQEVAKRAGYLTGCDLLELCDDAAGLLSKVALSWDSGCHAGIREVYSVNQPL